MGIIHRKGRVEAYRISTPSKTILVGKIKERIGPTAELVITDEDKSYTSIADTYCPGVFNHMREWIRRNVHASTIGNFCSLFKRGVIGSFIKLGAKDLPRYLAEFTYRVNRREEESPFLTALASVLSSATLPYRRVAAES